MLSTLPSRSNNYKVDSQTRMSAEVFNAVFVDLAMRMLAIEAKGATFDDLVNEGIGVALSRINDVQAPAVENLNTLISQANQYLNQVKQNNIAASIINTDPNNRFVSDPQITAINSISQLAAAIATLQAVPSNEGRSFFFSTM